jgi:uncharacterized membrane protein YiaA
MGIEFDGFKAGAVAMAVVGILVFIDGLILPAISGGQYMIAGVLMIGIGMYVYQQQTIKKADNNK